MSEWIQSDLGRVATLQRGFDLPSRLRRHGSTPIVSSSGTSGWHDKPMVKAPGVVTGRYGTIGEVFYVEEDFWPLNTTLWVSNFHGNDERFVYYLLQRINFAAHSGKSGVPGVNRNDLHTEVVPLPPSIEEQRAIASALMDADELIKSMQRLIAKKQAIKKGMMQQLLTGKTRLHGFTKKWASCPIANLADQHRGVVNPKSQPNLVFQHFSLPAFDSGVSAVFERGSSIDSSKFRVPSGAVLLSKLNPRIPRVWAPSEIHKNAVSSTEFIVLLPKNSTNRSFLKWLLKSESVTGRMALLATGTTGSHQRMHPGQVAQLEVDVPSEANEQSAIAAVLDDAERSIELLRIQLCKARSIRNGMMQELLTGRTRLQPLETTV